MHDITEIIKAKLDVTGELVAVILNLISLFFIVFGVIISLVKSIKEKKRVIDQHPFHTYFRTLLGGSLVVALELQLAADIVGTIVSPSTEHLIELGAIAFIRTLLNYFLNKELWEQRELFNKKIPEQ